MGHKKGNQECREYIMKQYPICILPIKPTNYGVAKLDHLQIQTNKT